MFQSFPVFHRLFLGGKNMITKYKKYKTKFLEMYAKHPAASTSIYFRPVSSFAVVVKLGTPKNFCFRSQ